MSGALQRKAKAARSDKEQIAETKKNANRLFILIVIKRVHVAAAFFKAVRVNTLSCGMADARLLCKLLFQS